jgi:hypothetical protein
MERNDKINKTNLEGLWQHFRRIDNTPTGVLAWISIFLNILVIATFLKVRKSKGKLPQAALQLLILAISEVAASLFWALGLLYFLIIENTSLSKNPTVYMVLFRFGYISAGLSRVLTLYIVASRVYVMWSFRHAHRSLQKTEKDHIRETILFAVLPGLLLVFGTFSASTYTFSRAFTGAFISFLTRGIRDMAHGGSRDAVWYQ